MAFEPTAQPKTWSGAICRGDHVLLVEDDKREILYDVHFLDQKGLTMSAESIRIMKAQDSCPLYKEWNNLAYGTKVTAAGHFALFAKHQTRCVITSFTAELPVITTDVDHKNCIWKVEMTRGSPIMGSPHTVVLEDFEAKREQTWTSESKVSPTSLTVASGPGRHTYSSVGDMTTLELCQPHVEIRRDDRAQICVKVHRDNTLILNGEFCTSDITDGSLSSSSHVRFSPRDKSHDKPLEIVVNACQNNSSWCQRTVYSFPAISIYWQ